MNQWEKLVSILELDKSKRKELVLALGYKDISKGCHKLMTQIRSKSISEEQLEIIAKFLAFEFEELSSDYFKVKESIKKEKKLLSKISELEEEIRFRDNFKPYIYIESTFEKPTPRPSIITGIALFSSLKGYERFKHIKTLPENIETLSKLEQLAIVKEIILAHYSKEKGCLPFFGDITGFTYYWKYNNGIRFSILGEVIKE